MAEPEEGARLSPTLTESDAVEEEEQFEEREDQGELFNRTLGPFSGPQGPSGPRASGPRDNSCGKGGGRGWSERRGERGIITVGNEQKGANLKNGGVEGIWKWYWGGRAG